MKYIQTIKSIMVYPEGEPWFHELATEVSLEDEGGGYYVVLTQSPDCPELGQVRLDPEELEAVCAAAKQLLTQHNNDNCTTNTSKSVWSKCSKAV
jgi:predicted DNA-binding transcriptional regulator YafY